MGEKPSQIEQEIARTRAELGANLEELEYKLKNVTDWRWQFQKRPFTIIGLAFGVGILLAAIFGGDQRRVWN